MTADPRFWWCPTHHLYRGGEKRPCADAVRLVPASPTTEDPRISEVRTAVADFEQHGTNGLRTPGQMLREVLDILDRPASTPRVFFPGDTVPAHTPVVNHVGGVWRQHTDRVVKTGYALEITLPSPEERDHAAARALRARDEREEPPA